MASQTQFPEGFKREKPATRIREPIGGGWGTEQPVEWGSSQKSNISKEDLIKAISVNSETLKALQTVGKGIDTVIYNEHKGFDNYLSDLKKITQQQQDLEMQIEAERKQNEKRNKEELRILLHQISELSGLKEEDVSKSLSDKNSELFKNLPENLSSALEVLLNDDKDLINTILRENQEVKKKEDQRQKEEYENRKKKEKQFFGNFITKTNDVFDKNSDVLRQSLLGPVNLLLGPMEEFFGFDAYEGIKGFLFGSEGKRGEEGKDGVFKSIGKKLFKKRPTPNDVANTGDMGSLLINNTLQDIYGKPKKGKGDDSDTGFGEDFLGTLTGTMFAKMIPGLLAALPAMMGVILPVLLGAATLAIVIGAIRHSLQKDEERKEETKAIYVDRGMTEEEAAVKTQQVITSGTLEARQGSSRNMVSAEAIVARDDWNTKWRSITAASRDGDREAKFIEDAVKASPNFRGGSGNTKMEPHEILKRFAGYAQYKDIIAKYHIGGIIGEKNAVGAVNNDYIIAQKGEVILPISESNFGLQSGILQPTSEGGMEISREYLQYNAPAISLSPINNQVTTTNNEEKNQESITIFTTENIESKLETMIGLLQSLLTKDPIQIPSPKQSNSDLEMLIYGGAF